MNIVSIIFPHQLFENNPCLDINRKVIIVEENLFFSQYLFHRQKILFHRATMKFYEDYLKRNKYNVQYIDKKEDNSDVRNLIPWLIKQGVDEIHYTEVTDDWLDDRIKRGVENNSVRLRSYPSPMFLNDIDELKSYFGENKRFYQTRFYIHQRKKMGVLVDDQNKPYGGRWSFDKENRQKYPRGKTPPGVMFPEENDYVREAGSYVKNHFRDNYGELPGTRFYPATFDEARTFSENFFKQRLYDFGTYEDAIVCNENFLNHSVLSPILNTGLITPKEIVSRAIDYASEYNIPLNSTEGFIRQVTGWREFIRGVYELKGRDQRTMNFWKFKRKIPRSFYDGTTGILPVDTVIKKVLKTGYCHHIERLMVLGNFMLLCEFDPDEVYRWFMELFIDSYDWVMVPNVYGMSQFADGGIMSTKPYISSSNYLRKMGDFPGGKWEPLWDALFWRFMHVHSDFFNQNPRMRMLLKTFERKPDNEKNNIFGIAENYLNSL